VAIMVASPVLSGGSMEGSRLRPFKWTWGKRLMTAVFFIELLILWAGLYALAWLLAPLF
jgi:hypothetical protein